MIKTFVMQHGVIGALVKAVLGFFVGAVMLYLLGFFVRFYFWAIVEGWHTMERLGF